MKKKPKIDAHESGLVHPTVIVGFVDEVSSTAVSGWAKAEGRDEFVTVVAYQDGLELGRSTADHFRQDLLDASFGSGSHGFRIDFVQPVESTDNVSVQIESDSNTVTLPFSNRVIDAEQVLPTPHDVICNIDSISQRNITGWARSNLFPDAKVMVEFYHQEEKIGEGLAAQFRSDLFDHGLDDGHFGFSAQFLNDLPAESIVEIQVLIPAKPSLGVVSTKFVPLAAESKGVMPQLHFAGHVDHCSRTEAWGWAWCKDHPDRSVLVQVFDEGVFRGETIADMPREDLIGWGVGDGQYGFRIKFDRPLTGSEQPKFRLSLTSPVDLEPEQMLSRKQARHSDQANSDSSHELIGWHSFYSNAGPRYEDQEQLITPIEMRQADVLAYYLPQFHSIEENDDFWGRRFTEWRQLPRSIPRFPGHYQPRIPRDLGFYDLEDGSVYREQSELAKAAGITAFGIYYYWFDAKRVLERPLEAVLQGSDGLPFFLVWANENWTRTWDGSEKEVLLGQNYLLEDDEELIADISRHLFHKNYYTIDGRPLFIIYRPGSIPEAASRIAHWRTILSEKYNLKPLIYMAQAFGDTDPNDFGLDGAIEFPPHKLSQFAPSRPTPDAYSKEFDGRVISYDHFVSRSLGEVNPAFPLIKTAVPSWDNDCRRPNRGLTLENSSPEKFQAWISALVAKNAHPLSNGRAVIAVNAWNEWAEGAYLEPDVHYGFAYLNALSRGNAGRPALTKPLPKVTVICPCYNHAEFIEARLSSIIGQTVAPHEIIFLDDCSTDDSVLLAEKVLSKCSIPYTIVRNGTNGGGPFPQWLKGMDRAKHDVIWIAETDDWCEPNFLRELLQTLEETPGCVAAFGRSSCINELSDPLIDLDDYYEGLDGVTWTSPWNMAGSKLFKNSFVARNIIPNASSLLFRRPILSLRERDIFQSFSFAGDWYFYALMLRSGTLAYNPAAGSFFRVRASSASRDRLLTEKHLEEHRVILREIANIYNPKVEALQKHVEILSCVFGRPLEYEDITSLVSYSQRSGSLRICIAAHSLAIGGGEIVPIMLANALVEMGHSVTYLIVDSAEDGAKKRLRPDITVYYLEDVIDDFGGFVSHHRFDVINSHNISVDYALYLRRIAIGCPYVSSLHGGYEHAAHLVDDQFRSYLHETVNRWLYLSDKNLEPLKLGDGDREALVKVFNAAPRVPAESLVTYRADHGIGEETCLFVLCSRAVEGKGWDIAIETIRDVVLRGGDAHLLLIGDGPQLDHYRSLADGYSFVTFAGSVAAPLPVMEQCDVAIFPSTYAGETAPLFLLEAFSCGLPVITSDMGEIPAMMGECDFMPGFVLSSDGSREAWVQLFADAAEAALSVELRNEFQIRSKARAAEFDLDVLVQLYTRVFSEVAPRASLKQDLTNV